MTMVHYLFIDRLGRPADLSQQDPGTSHYFVINSVEPTATGDFEVTCRLLDLAEVKERSGPSAD